MSLIRKNKYLARDQMSIVSPTSQLVFLYDTPPIPPNDLHQIHLSQPFPCINDAYLHAIDQCPTSQPSGPPYRISSRGGVLDHTNSVESCQNHKGGTDELTEGSWGAQLQKKQFVTH